jgi:TRAP-type mannitol/chloroaromatic compound transport system permease large subunit
MRPCTKLRPAIWCHGIRIKCLAEKIRQKFHLTHKHPLFMVNVFATGSVAKEVPMQVIFRGIVPFFFCMVLCVLLLVLFPQIALFLPGLLF